MSTKSPELRPESAIAHRRAFVVVGMHRSGTSAMTRTLSLLGAALPKHVMPAAITNPSGFWEPQAVADLNDEILQAQDSEWDDVFAFRPHRYLSNFDHFYLGRAVELLDQQFNGSEVIVLKDPRISVLTSFWDRALSDAGYSIQYVVMVRNPLEVAESLRARDGFPREKSLLLWSSYMVAVERDTRDRGRIFVSYDQLMNDWRSVRQRIEASAGFPFPRDTAAAANEIDRHLDRNLRHHEASMRDLFSRSDVPDDVKELYRIFSDSCEGAEVDRAALEAIQAGLAKMDLLLGPLLADFRGRVRSLSSDVAQSNNAHAEATGRANSLAEELATERALRQAEAEAGTHNTAENERRVAELASRIAAAESERDRAVTETEELMRQLAERDRLAAESEELMRHQLAERDRLAAETEELMRRQLAERDRLAAESEELMRQLAERDRVAAESEELMRHQLAERDSLQQLLDRAQSNQFATEAELEKKESLVAEAREALARLEDRLHSELAQARLYKTQAQAQLSEHLGEITALSGKVEQQARAIAELRDALENKDAELGRAVEQSKAEKKIAEAKLNERFGELATLTNLLAESETRERQANEQVAWLREAGSILVNGSPTLKGHLLALLPAIFQAKRQRRLLKRKGLFDSGAYLAANADVAADGVDPLRHYLKHGMSEKRRRS